ncbi:ubiquinol-cytochrome C reductase complex 14kD subunit [Botrytis cinerea]
MSAPSLASWISKKPGLLKMMKPLASWYTNAAGYRQLGLRADDLLPEESEEVLLALKRLPQKEAYDRVFRLRRAVQCSVQHQLLPKDQHTKPEEVRLRIPLPIIAEIEAEAKERADLESLTITKKN